MRRIKTDSNDNQTAVEQIQELDRQGGDRPQVIVADSLYANQVFLAVFEAVKTIFALVRLRRNLNLYEKPEPKPAGSQGAPRKHGPVFKMSKPGRDPDHTETFQLGKQQVCYGLPEQISLDHDSAFYDNKSASPFPSVIHLWLIALGVQVRFIHKRPPLEHSRSERHHQTIAGQAFDGQIFADVNSLQCSLQSRMLFLNQEYPTRALNGQPPFQAFPQARHSSRIYSPDAEEQLIDLQRIRDYLQAGR